MRLSSSERPHGRAKKKRRNVPGLTQTVAAALARGGLYRGARVMSTVVMVLSYRYEAILFAWLSWHQIGSVKIAYRVKP